MASLTLLVAERDNEAPKTAIVDTQGETHHERSCGLGRAAGTSHGVLSAQSAGDAAQAGQGPPEHAGHRTGHQWREHADPDEGQEGSEAHQADLWRAEPDT